MQDIKAGWVLLRFSFVAKYLYLTARTDLEICTQGMERAMRPHREKEKKKGNFEKKMYHIFQKQKPPVFQFLR